MPKIDVTNLFEESYNELLKTKKKEEITAEDIGKKMCDIFDEAFRISATIDTLKIPKNKLTEKEKKYKKLIDEVFFTK